jgi:hypothetical protein
MSREITRHVFRDRAPAMRDQRSNGLEATHKVARWNLLVVAFA